MSSILQNFWLPNATTWFCFSALLAVGLFFKFTRLLSVRNWDVVMIFLLVPGVLLIEDSQPTAFQKRVAVDALGVAVSAASGSAPIAGVASMGALAHSAGLANLVPKPSLRLGYIWLLCGSGYLLLRCLFDLALVQRPALSPNMNLSGLAWLATALFFCLAAVAFRPDEGRQPVDQTRQFHGPANSEADKGGRESAALELGQRSLEGWGLAQRTMAVVCHLIVCAGLIVVCKLHFKDALAGVAAVTFYLMLPYTGHYVPYLLHVWPMAVIVWALAAYRLPTVAGLLLGLAAGTVYFPLLLFPLWWSFYRGRGAGRFTMAFLLMTGAVLLVTGLMLLWSDDLGKRISDAIGSSSWQPWKAPSAEGIWQGIPWAYRIPVFVVFLAFVVMTAIWPVPKNLAHVIALSAAVLIGVQFWYADRGGQYVLWYLPLLLLLMFRPNLSDRRPLPIVPETDWLAGLKRALARWASWPFRLSENVARVR